MGMLSTSPENPREPVIVEKSSNSTLIECPRCMGKISVAGSYCVGFRPSDREWEKGLCAISINEKETSKLRGPALATCSVCDGKSKLRTTQSSPLSVCKRCRGRGYIVLRSKRLQYLDDIEQAKQAKREKKKTRNPSGLLERIKHMNSIPPEERKIRRIKEKMERKTKVASEDNRILRLRNCPTCGGCGVDTETRGFSEKEVSGSRDLLGIEERDEDDEESVTECQRCDGVGRMVVKYKRTVTNALRMVVVDGCEVCDGTGKIPIDEEASFTECPSCSGSGQVDTSDSGPHNEVSQYTTCRRCSGKGFLYENEISTF